MKYAYLFTVGDYIEIQTPYIAGFVDDLKRVVPFRCRKWDPDRKVWTIFDPYVWKIRDLMDLYYEVEEDEGPAPENPHYDQQERSSYTHTSDYGPKSTTDHALFFITNNAPRFVIKAIHRALVKEYHPDISQNPDEVMIKAVNAAWDRFQLSWKMEDER